MKKIPLRTCIVTKEKLPKQDLIRIVKDKDNNVIVDLTGKKNGRGVYLKKDAEVILKAKAKGYLNRALETEVSSEIFDELLKLLK